MKFGFHINNIMILWIYEMAFGRTGYITNELGVLRHIRVRKGLNKI